MLHPHPHPTLGRLTLTFTPHWVAPPSPSSYTYGRFILTLSLTRQTVASFSLHLTLTAHMLPPQPSRSLHARPLAHPFKGSRHAHPLVPCRCRGEVGSVRGFGSTAAVLIRTVMSPTSWRQSRCPLVVETEQVPPCCGGRAGAPCCGDRAWRVYPPPLHCSLPPPYSVHPHTQKESKAPPREDTPCRK